MRLSAKISVSPFLLLYLSVVFLLFPPQSSAAFLLAAVLHEGGHLLCLFALRAPLHKIRFSPGGAAILTSSATLSYSAEAALYLCGPICNLCALVPSLFFSAPFFSLFFAANLLSACYNLLPILPLDGAKALFCLLSPRLGEQKATRILRRIGSGCGTVLLLFGIWLLLSSLHAPPAATLGALSLFFGALGLFFLGIPGGAPRRAYAKSPSRKKENSRGKRSILQKTED